MSRVGSVVGITFLAAGSCLAQPAAAPASLEGLTPEQAFIEKHCIECHNSTDQSAAALFAGLFFDKLDVTHIGEDPETWEKVVRKLGAGMMPPAVKPRPDSAEQARVPRLPRNRARRTRESATESRPPCPAPRQPQRVRERGPRSARARDRRDGAVAGRRLELRLRQYRGLARRLAGACSSAMSPRPARSAASRSATPRCPTGKRNTWSAAI